ncbi:MAG: type II secretion system F family protein [Hydrogenobaculum sp.]|nr:MAG: type II secretion system F family protein [Hydrogenobaculum sp.]
MDFEYVSLDKTGKEIRGILSANSIQEAKTKLKETGLIIVKVEPKKEGIFTSTQKISDDELYTISKEMSVLLNSGIVIDRALKMVIDSIEQEKLKLFLENILKDVKGGKSLSSAFEEKKMFDSLVITMLKVGETTGNLKDAFDNIAQYTDFRIKFRNEIRNAMAYPMFLVFASFVTLVAIFKLIIPRFFSIFGSNPKHLPFVSRILYEFSKNLNTKTELIFTGLLIGIYMLSKYFQLNLYRRFANYFIYAPILGNLIIQIELSKFSYAMYAMLKNGVEFIKALDLATNVIKNDFIKEDFKKTSPKIREGKSIGDAFEELRFVPPIFKGMVKVGEESGNMKDMFYELYSLFDEKLKNTIKRVLSLVEPIIITVMGLIVGTIVVSLMLTVMNVSNIKL